jgi:hypothetical protein
MEKLRETVLTSMQETVSARRFYLLVLLAWVLNCFAGVPQPWSMYIDGLLALFFVWVVVRIYLATKPLKKLDSQRVDLMYILIWEELFAKLIVAVFKSDPPYITEKALVKLISVVISYRSRRLLYDHGVGILSGRSMCEMAFVVALGLKCGVGLSAVGSAFRNKYLLDIIRKEISS